MSSEFNDLDRFAEFLARRGTSYNDPPDPPRDAMWSEIERGIESANAGDAGGAPASAVASDDDLVASLAGYNAPPVTPHDDMWDRVEAAWTLRRAAPIGVREAGLDDLDEGLWGIEPGPRPRRAIARWGTVVGIAASLVIGIAIGRTSSGPTPESGPTIAAGETPVGQDASGRPGRGETDAVGGEPGEPLETAPLLAEADPGFEPLETAPATGTTRLAVTGGSGPPALDATSESESAGGAGGARTRWSVAVRLATARHLGQAETLLTSFRADADASAPDETQALSGWARELLGETRLLLDLPLERAPREVELLEELELVLAQIARLGPDAPDFERDIVSDGLARQGTIARLRAASPPGAVTSIGT